MAIDNLDNNGQEILENFKSLREAFETQTEALDGYIEGHDEINLYNKGEKYILDTEEVYERNKWTIKDLEDIENISKDRKLENFIDDYEWDKREFTNLNLTSVLEEYKGKEEKQNYLKIRDKEINKEIEVFNSNYDKIEDVMDALAKFEIRAEDIINELEKYNKQIEEIKEFEESYNPGFFDKHEKGLKVFNFIVHTTLDIVGMVPGIGWMADLANAGLYLVQGNYTAAIGSAISVVPGLGAAVKLSKGKKGLKVAEKGVEVAENNLNKAKKIRKNTKRKTKGPSSKLTSKYKQAVKNQNQAVKNHNQAKDVYKEALNTSNKLKVGAEDNMKLRNLTSKATGLADMFTDDGNNGYDDDIIEGGISWGIGKGAEQIGGDIFKAVT